MSSDFFYNFKQNPFWRRITNFFKGLSAFAIIAMIASIGILGGIFFAYIDTASELTPDQLRVNDSKTVLYDIAGSDVEIISGSENREWANIDTIPINLQQAFISIEDERFYKHHGIDFRRIAGAIISALKPGEATFGASTITQQLVKNLTQEDQRTLKRKIQEQWRAIQIEKKLTKKQILELYLNIVPLGNNIEGVRAAAKGYFGKDVDELTLAESACIAGITQYPVKYDPFTHPDNNKKRQEAVLSKMKDLGYIDEKTYEKAEAEKLVFKKGAFEVVSNHSYFADQVINDVARDLQQKNGLSKSIAEKMVYGGGLKIYTTMDSNVQKSMDKVYTDSNFFVKTNTNVQPESAMIIIDPKDGGIRGIVGGIGEKKGKRTLDRATQSYRQPGSSIKPIAVYGPAIEKGLITPNSVFDDSPMKIGDWEPHNYDNSYWGNMTIRTAVTNSRNIIAVKVLQKLGLEESFSFLKRLGITTLQPADLDYAPLALGALSKGVSPLELAAAYVPFANGGIYIKPYTYLKVVDGSGNLLLENSINDSSVVYKPVMTEHTSFVMTDLLQNVVRSGTATLARLKNMPAAGKTGTAADMKDKWFAGYTPYYVGVVWYGYDQPQELPSSTWNEALLAWKAVMEGAHANLEYKDFPAPKEFSVQLPICTLSGKIATNACYHDMNGSVVKLENFVKGSEPTEYCTNHKTVKICNVSGKLATIYCPAESVEEKSIYVGDGQSIDALLGQCDVHTAAQPKNTTKSTATRP